jgi:hypothetical protein
LTGCWACSGTHNLSDCPVVTDPVARQRLVDYARLRNVSSSASPSTTSEPSAPQRTAPMESEQLRTYVVSGETHGIAWFSPQPSTALTAPHRRCHEQPYLLWSNSERSAGTSDFVVRAGGRLVQTSQVAATVVLAPLRRCMAASRAHCTHTTHRATLHGDPRTSGACSQS